MTIKKIASGEDLKDFKSWLDDQIAEYGGWTAYDPQSPSNCLVCQYMKARGFSYANFNGPSVIYVHSTNREYALSLIHI